MSSACDAFGRSYIDCFSGSGRTTKNDERGVQDSLVLCDVVSYETVVNAIVFSSINETE